ncbi:MAG TPA: hypothetical protein VE338_06510 [Ktedonobacterales bacterium]|nr:hypothetical protein [Ktedonobacterales bacterium]
MATETSTSRGSTRWYARSVWRLVLGALALCVLAALAVEVVAPLSAGLPLGWGQYHNSQHHLRVGTPPFWNVIADNSINQGALTNCAFAVVASPLSESAPHSTANIMRMSRWMGVFVTDPCDSGAGAAGQASLWRATGQSVVVAGQREPVQMETVGAPQVSERVDVSLHGYAYTFMLQDPTAAQAQQDMPDFLTLVRSFRYTS